MQDTSEFRRDRAWQIVLAATNPGERYRLLRGDQLVFEAIGDGARLELATGPLNESTELELELVAAPAPDALVVERRLRLSVQVQS